ncbi:hypothetical protein TL16_g13010 [Triparma laevis f. inornata]|uniref:Uncharacterized protein n=2 Tax=Triparma laevis TaxID=1534972 RepID=A0A9W7B260_9STRA|nr:hypothetical protein TrLO_g12031 [Triparma laevis f. longispina]GMH94814.1 hypothetical protein TL16_g13010 [Triparma laevis f. inornata]
MSIFMCLGATRVYCRKRPFISNFHDTFAEVAQRQLFLTMFCVLAIRANLDGTSLQDKGYFDFVITVLQFLPMLLVIILSRKEVIEEARRDFEEGMNSFGRGYSGGEGEKSTAQKSVNPLIMGGGDQGNGEEF